MGRTPRILALAMVLMALAPTASALAGCPPIPIRTIGAIDAVKKDLRKPTYKEVPRTDWKLDTSWFAVKPRMVQWVKLKNGLRFYGYSFSTQITPSIDAYAPEDLNKLYVDDNDVNTQPCQMVGQSMWQEPKIWVKETAKLVRVTAASQKTVGDDRGCVLGEPNARECPILTRTVPRLKKPIGNRTIVFERFQ